MSLIVFLARTPLHGLVSRTTLLLTYADTTTGEETTLPIGYLEDGARLLIPGSRERIWWHSLRGGASVTVRWKGHDYSATAQPIESGPELLDSLKKLLAHYRTYQKYFNVWLGPDGTPRDPARLAALPERLVIIRLDNLEET